MITEPNAYLITPATEEDTAKQNQFIAHLTMSIPGTTVPMKLGVVWVDAFGEPAEEGYISGTIATVLNTGKGYPIAVFSTGESVALTNL